MTLVRNAFSLLSDASARLIDDGQVFIGEPFEDPELAPISVYWDKDLSIPAEQPLQTVAGYITRDGTPARVYAAGDYSIRVRQANGEEVYYDPDSTEYTEASGGGSGGETIRANLAALKAADTSLGVYLFEGVPFIWETANAPYTPDEDRDYITTVESNSTPATDGAWRRFAQVQVMDQPASYGVVADGTTVVTEPLRAQNQDHTQELDMKGGVQELPIGDMVIDDFMYLGSYSDIIGKGSRRTIFYNATGYTGPAFKRGDGAQYGRSRVGGFGIRGNFSHGILITDDTDGNDFFDIDIVGATNNSFGVSGFWQTGHLDRVILRDAPTAKGFVCVSFVANNMRATKCEVQNHGDTNLQLAGAEDFTWAGCRFEGGGVVGKYTFDLKDCRVLAFDGGYMESTHQYAAKIRTSQSVHFSNFHFTGTGAFPGGTPQGYLWDTDGLGELEFHRCRSTFPMRIPAHSIISGTNAGLIPCTFSSDLTGNPRLKTTSSGPIMRFTRVNTTSANSNTTSFRGILNLYVHRQAGTSEPEFIRSTMALLVYAKGNTISASVSPLSSDDTAVGVTVGATVLSPAILDVIVNMPPGWTTSAQVYVGFHIEWTQWSTIDQNLFGVEQYYG